MAKRFTAVVVGPQLEVVRALLRDGLEAIGVEFMEPGAGPADIVLALVDRAEPRQVVAGAMAVARGAPVMAVLSFPDDLQIEQSLAAGAGGCYALARPLDELRAAVVAILAGAKQSKLPPTLLDPVRPIGASTGVPPAPDLPATADRGPGRGQRP